MKNIISFSLGLEEIALVLSMINRPDLGKRYLLSASPKMTNEQMDARLTSASHSLAARGLASISDKGKAVLEAELEKSLLPLAKFDNMIQLSKTDESGKEFYSIHILHDRVFTSHLIKMGVIHCVEYGEYSLLAEYIADKFGKFGDNRPDRSVQNGHSLTLGKLGELMKEYNKSKGATTILNNAGLDEKLSTQLSFDIAEQCMRGAIVSIDVSSNEKTGNTIERVEKTLLLLKGQKHNWMFEFGTSNDEEVARISLVSRAMFIKNIKRFISKN